MKFYQAVEEIEELSFTEDGGDSWVNNHSSVYSLIQELQETYAPTIEMTKAEKTMLLNYLEMSSLREFMDVILYQDGNLYEKLSDEDIVQAWLHPETIKVVD